MFSMSFTSELDIYGRMVAEGMVMKNSLLEEQSEQCLTLLKQEQVENKLAISEEIVVDTNGYQPDKIDKTDVTMYFEQDLDDSGKISVKYEETNSSTSLTENLISENWESEDVGAISSLKESEASEEDEETIATFITAKGEQLALYAVENFDEMFAVAVYDESGKPPTDFQFLTKGDVERLISEGAVQTVKKPLQMKRRLVTTQPQMFYHKEEDFEGMNEQEDDKVTIPNIIDSEKSVIKEENYIIEEDYQVQNSNDSLGINSTSGDLIYSTVDTQSDITYLMMDDDSAIVDADDEENDESHKSEDYRACESELVERSTVQYIFFEDEQQSDSELTFDEIQATLQNLKTSREKIAEKEDEKSELQDKQDTILHDSSMKSLNEDLDFSSPLPSMTDNLTCVSAIDDKFENERQRLIDTLTDSPPPPPPPSMPSSSSSSASLSTTLQLKVKRSRKQQLISVNRDDGEIIFQPASLLQNEEIVGKKRGKRRGPSSQMRRGYMDAKRIKRPRQRKVEVIDLDSEEEQQQAKRNIVEITLDDNSTDKYSSDKENEIIMVRDSDSDNGDDEGEEEEEDRLASKLSRMIRCEHCSRNFRQRRALETHLRVCQKSPENALRLAEGKRKVQMNKQYQCKICQEKFNVVVALARHVRVAHSLRKKHKLRFVSPKTQKSLDSVQKEASSTEEEEEEELSHRDDTAKREHSMLARVKRKRRKRGNYSWEKNNLTCADCGKLFLSTTTLNVHVLQHGTKKSEKRLRKCNICQKLIRSKFLFLRHVRAHSEAQSSSDFKILQRKLRTRSSPLKIASRKRGRPRKF